MCWMVRVGLSALVQASALTFVFLPLMRTLPAHAEAKSDSPTAIIDTLAGGGDVGDHGLATLARFNLPGGVTEAPNGDVVVVDFGNHRVRRIDKKTGIIRTIAGTGEAGYNGDNIPADKARLARPEFAVFNAVGDLFIADSYNNRVRRVDHATGLISTVAGTGERGFSGDGGLATSANLHFPEGIALDSQGNLFISDTVNRRIRRVDMRTGIIDTYAGTGMIATNAEGTPAVSAGFLRLARIAVDHTGNVYVADSPSHRLLIIDSKTRQIRTFAGTGKPGFSGDGEAATAAELSFPEGVVIAPNQDVYFADVGNHRIRKIDVGTGIISTVAGTGEKGFAGDGGTANLARLWSPGRVWVGASGDLLIADILNARIRRVDAKTHVIKTIAGTGDWGDGGPARKALLSVPGDVVFSAGKVFIADYGTRRVRCVDLATGIITTVAGGGTRSGEGIPATEADLLLPEGIAVDSGRMLYIADNISNHVWQVDLKTGLLTRFAGGGKQDPGDEPIPARSARLQMPSALAIGANGEVYISEFGSQRL
ncbi:MAG TPA: NHL repeat-containing protein, partial [Candidatus Angelobacter sp.]